MRLFAADDWIRDLRHGLRSLWRCPAFTLVATLTLGLGVGAVTVIYSVVYNVVVAPLPYRDADRLVNVMVEDARSGRVRGTFSFAELQEFSAQTNVFEDVIGTLGQGMRYETADSVEFLRAVWVTPNFFDFMGLPPLIGRTIRPEDGKPGAPAVAVLRHRAWATYFASDPAVVGKTIALNGEPRIVVGVMPPRFTWHAADIWIPGPIDRTPPAGAIAVRNFQARLKPGVTLEQAAAQLDTLARRRASEYPKDYPEQFRMQVLNVIAYTVGAFSGVLWVTLAAVGLLLLIACCNVGNMLLARATTREREMMVRVALGASRGRIVRQLFIESLLLSAAGAVAGSLLAYAGIGALVARLPQNPLPGEVEIALNGPVLLFSLAIAASAALVFGLAPALYVARRDLTATTLRGAGRVTGGRGHLRNTLVAAEIALSLVLVLGAGLLMRSFVSVMREDLGFDPARLTFVGIAFPPGRYTAPSDKQRFYDEALHRIRLIPGLEAAALTSGVPPFEMPVSGVALPGEPDSGDAKAVVRWVTADFFRALDIPVIRGSIPPDLTVDEAARQVVVNQTFVRHYFAGQDAIGRRIELLPVNEPPDPQRHRVYEVAAVVADIRNQGLRAAADPEVYLPWSGAVRGTPSLLLRTAGSPANSLKSVRQELAAVDRQVAVVQARALTEILDRSFYAQPRFSLLVLGIFAVTGIVLVGVGVFSLTAYTVSRQKKEIAVRIALGAARSDVYAVVFRIALRLVAAGIATGVLASFATNRLLTTQLWNVSPNDPLTLTAATILVASIAFAACYIPARRAMRVDPIVALRED